MGNLEIELVLRIGQLRVNRILTFENDSVFSAEFNPPLTGVSLHAEEIGREAAALLLERLKTPSERVVCKIIPSEIVVRESCQVWRPHNV